MISFPTILLRLSVALFLGALVDLERESNEHEAGLRTNALVSLGCALFTLISGYGFLSFLNMVHIQVDPTRIASYVIAGIGFLGGGVIFHQQGKEKVKGLTTAAAIWVVAAIGMACGAGLLWEAVLVTILTLIVLVVLRYVEPFILPRRPLMHTLQIEMHSSEEGHSITQVFDICTRHSIEIEKVTVCKTDTGEQVRMNCLFGEKKTLPLVLDELHRLPEVRQVSIDATDSEKKAP